jgi:hypothetical protein
MLRLPVLLVCLCSLAATAAESPALYVAEVEESSGPKPLKMRLEETERGSKHSIVQVTRSSGASVPSVMFVVRGMWEIARRRNAAYFINLKEWTTDDGKTLYKVGFADTDQVDVKAYFGEAPADPKFLSVKEYAEIFGD